MQIGILAEQVFTLKITNTLPFRSVHYAIGKIQYPDSNPGILLYLKSSLTGDEPADILGHHATHMDFPHDTTANQFFNEAMFEAYRALGEHMMDTLLHKFGVPDDGNASRQKIVDLYQALTKEVG